jgi:hypothetical protein
MLSKNKDWRELDIAPEEVELLESIESGDWVSVGDIEERKQKLRNFFSQNDVLDSVSIEIDKDTYNLMMSKCKQFGVSYNVLITKLIQNININNVAL